MARAGGCDAAATARLNSRWWDRVILKMPFMTLDTPSARFVVAAVAAGVMAQLAPPAQAAPAPEVEYVYDVMVRRHYNFPDNDAVGYGHRICDDIASGQGYVQVMAGVKNDVSPNDEFAANYLVSNAVNLLCPGQIWLLRNSAAHYGVPQR